MSGAREAGRGRAPAPAAVAAAVAAVAACLGVAPDAVRVRPGGAVPAPEGRAASAGLPAGRPSLWALAGRQQQMASRRLEGRSRKGGRR